MINEKGRKKVREREGSRTEKGYEIVLFPKGPGEKDGRVARLGVYTRTSGRNTLEEVFYMYRKRGNLYFRFNLTSVLSKIRILWKSSVRALEDRRRRKM